MKILSIEWTGGSPSTAALMVDGRIESCVSEERFSRIKNDESYPFKSIEFVLSFSGIDAKDLDSVVVTGENFAAFMALTHKLSTFSVSDMIREQHEYWYPKLYEGREISYADVFEDKIDLSQYPGNWKEVLSFFKNGNKDGEKKYYQNFRRNTISTQLHINPEKIIFCNHHRAHVYYAYYASPMEKDKSVILAAEGWGDNMNASVSFAQRGDIKTISTSIDFNIGRMYRYITLLLGMKADVHEYKVMGLAAYAKEKYYRDPLSVFENTMYIDGLGVAYKERPLDLYFYFKEKLEGFRFDSIAGALQKYTEDILVKWADNALKFTGAKKICFGGGVGLNVKAMMEIAKLPELEEIFVCPASSDESLAIGAAYVVMHDIISSRKQDPSIYSKPLTSAYLGPAVNHQELKLAIGDVCSKGYKVIENPDLRYVASLLASGQIIGRCVGRSEFGPRALGNRSILADPRRLENVKIINEKVKSRDFWMPFAPSILAEKANYYLDNPKGLKSPYMSITFETKPPAWEDLKAAIHPSDLTTRPQIVAKESNAQYHSLLSEFHKLTNVAGLLNTSFNLHGEPIVQTPQDALNIFNKTDLNALLLDDYLIERK